MAMLAEKRRRVKYCLNPNGNTWNNDNSKFGQKLLEKMGWRKGQGLGANNQGITERLKVAYKFDSSGLGFKEKDMLLQQQNDFQSLLLKLNTEKNDQVNEQYEVASLEEKSKKSKTRVHYQKFTRGKDISRYSSKDLNCILGTGVPSSNVAQDNVTESNGNLIYGGSMNSYFEKKIMKNSDNVKLKLDYESESNVACEDQCEKEKEDSVNDGGLEHRSETLLSNCKKSKSKKKKRKEICGDVEEGKAEKEMEIVHDGRETEVPYEKSEHKSSRKRKDVYQNMSGELDAECLNVQERNGFVHGCNSDRVIKNKSPYQEEAMGNGCETELPYEKNKHKSCKKKKDVYQSVTSELEAECLNVQDGNEFLRGYNSDTPIKSLPPYQDCDVLSSVPERKKKKKLKRKRSVEKCSGLTTEETQGEDKSISEAIECNLREKLDETELQDPVVSENNKLIHENNLHDKYIKVQKEYPEQSSGDKNFDDKQHFEGEVYDNCELEDSSGIVSDDVIKKTKKSKKRKCAFSEENNTNEKIEQVTGENVLQLDVKKNHEVENEVTLASSKKRKKKQKQQISETDVNVDLVQEESIENDKDYSGRKERLDSENLKRKLKHMRCDNHDKLNFEEESVKEDPGKENSHHVNNSNTDSLSEVFHKPSRKGKREKLESVAHELVKETPYNEQEKGEYSAKQNSLKSESKNSVGNELSAEGEVDGQSKPGLDSNISGSNDNFKRRRLLQEFKRKAVREFNGFLGSNLHTVTGYGNSLNEKISA